MNANSNVPRRCLRSLLWDLSGSEVGAYVYECTTPLVPGTYSWTVDPGRKTATITNGVTGEKFICRMAVEKWVGSWFPQTAYALGNRVCHEGVVYKARFAHTSGAVFDPTAWKTDSAG